MEGNAHAVRPKGCTKSRTDYFRITEADDPGPAVLSFYVGLQTGPATTIILLSQAVPRAASWLGSHRGPPGAAKLFPVSRLHLSSLHGAGRAVFTECERAPVT